MARTGRFGRQPRSAPNLTNTLIAIAREAERQRDQNIMDAWMEGGKFEGKKVTDELVLAHWKARMEGVDKDDPLWDTYKNAHDQLDYQIHESKMTAAYATGKKTDAQMVAFYLGWAKKVPRNSEFWRVLQRDAGQYMRANKASNEAARRAAAEKRYQDAQTDTYNRRERAAEYMVDVFRRMAQSGNADAGMGPVIAGVGSGSDLTNFDPSDPEAMLRLIELITPTRETVIDVGGPGGPRKPGSEPVAGGVLYHDDNGNPVTGQTILDTLSKYDPQFATAGGRIDLDYVRGLMDTQIKGIDERIARAEKTGHMTDAENLRKQKSYFAMIGRQVDAWPIQQSYNIARAEYDKVVSDKTSSPMAVIKAWEAYKSTLFSLADDPRIAADDATRSRLIAEANGDAGAPTLAESFTGLSDPAFAGQATDSAENAAAIEFMQAQIDAVKTGGMVWTMGDLNDDGTFTPRAGGASIGAADPQPLVTNTAQTRVVYIPDARGEGSIPVYMQGIPITAKAQDANGLALKATSANPLGYAYDIVVGGVTTTVYGFDIQNPDGTTKTVFSTDPPWNEGAGVTNSAAGGNHIEVSLTRFAPQLTPEQLQKNGPVAGADGWYVQGATYNRTTGKWSGGELNFDPLAATFATDERNMLGTGAIDPNTDFFSPTLAGLMATDEGRAVLRTLDNNPVWKAQLEADAARYAGYTPDPANPGAWLPKDQASIDRFNEAMGQANRAQDADKLYAGFKNFLTEGLGAWQRITTGSPFKGGIANGQTEFDGQKLATDLVEGTPFEVLGRFFQQGTNLLKPPANSSGSPDDRMQINVQGPIKVPAVPDYIPPKAAVVTQPGTQQQTNTQTYNIPGGTNQYQQPSQYQSPYYGTTKMKELENL